jgi:hypothetical protein
VDAPSVTRACDFGHILACRLLFRLLRQMQIRRGCLQYTIEARELTNEYTHRPAFDMEARRTVIDAVDADQAITQYVRESEAELVSFTSPGRSRESIATVRKEDTIFLVRVYAA